MTENSKSAAAPAVIEVQYTKEQEAELAVINRKLVESSGNDFGVADLSTRESTLNHIDYLVNECDHDKDLVYEALLRKGIVLEKLPSVQTDLLIDLPVFDKLVSQFAREVAQVMKNKNVIFYRNDAREIVEVGEIKRDAKSTFQGFKSIRPNRFITLVENYFTPVKYSKEKDDFVRKSMNADLANTVLQSPQLQDVLPRIDRIFTIPIPIMYEGKLTFPRKGYDARFNSWLLNEAPTINPNIVLKDAIEIINNIFQEFCFTTEQDKTNAIAALLTPFLRGLYGKFNARTPVVFYKANRERSGKDYCAGITGIVFEGSAMEEPPVSNSEKYAGNDGAELRKKITAAFLYGRKRLHFSNNKGYIDNAVFESAATTERWSDRILGRNDIASFDNEIEFSLSGNIGISCTPDFANRCMFVNLFLGIEDANSRQFTNPNLHEWIKNNRSLIISALYALVRNWTEKEMPPGTKAFASYPEWARVCGGIMEAAGLGSPSAPDAKSIGVAGDHETLDMKILFEIMSTYSFDTLKTWITRDEIIAEILKEDIFSYLNFNDNGDRVKFGKQLSKYIGRTLSDIQLTVDDPNVRGSRQKYRFSKLGGSIAKDEN